MFKRYDDHHFGIFIPVWFKRWMTVWDPCQDEQIPGRYRKHFIFTYRRERIPCLSGQEIRIRIGFQYL